jgi:glutaminase
MTVPGRDTYVSTGQLPPVGTVHELVEEAHRTYVDVDDGEVSTVYPSLAGADPALFGVAVVSTAGVLDEAGDSRVPFTIMSVAKPFVLALVADHVGVEEVRRQVGVNATGLPFNSLTAVEAGDGGRTNPMVNAGAIVTTSLVQGGTTEERWQVVRSGLSRFAGRELEIDDEVHACAVESNHRNRAIAALLDSLGALATGPTEAVDLYTRQSCLRVTATDLAVMGATLADGGVNPLTGEQVVPAEVARATLAVMAVAGLYETSGDWLLDVGLPGKSGIGGGIVTVSPGKGGLGTFSPRLDAAGNSVRGRLASRHLARALGLDLFASTPHPPS